MYPFVSYCIFAGTEAGPKVLCKKKVFLKVFFRKVFNYSFLINLIKKETPAQVFSCEFCEILRNTFFTEHFRTIDFVRTIYPSPLTYAIQTHNHLVRKRTLNHLAELAK